MIHTLFHRNSETISWLKKFDNQNEMLPYLTLDVRLSAILWIKKTFSIYDDYIYILKVFFPETKHDIILQETFSVVWDVTQENVSCDNESRCCNSFQLSRSRFAFGIAFMYDASYNRSHLLLKTEHQIFNILSLADFINNLN